MERKVTSYEKYRKSLEETPGPTQPPADRSYDLRGLYDYIKKIFDEKVVRIS